MNKVLLSLFFLCGCVPLKNKNIENSFAATKVDYIEVSPVKKYAAPILVEKEGFNANIKKKIVGKILDEENERARQRPKSDRFFNAITVYDFMEGALYQVYGARLRTTSIMLGPGEKISGGLIIGDSVSWKTTIGGAGENKDYRQIIYLKPIMSGRKTNLTIPTNKRIYYLELTSFVNSFMTSVRWNYEDSTPVENNQIALNLETSSLDNLNFNYSIKRIRGNPVWMPKNVYDNGIKTFIRFDRRISSDELPALFIVTNESKIQLVNYRFNNNVMIVDRLFHNAELRLGQKRPQIIRIKRNSK